MRGVSNVENMCFILQARGEGTEGAGCVQDGIDSYINSGGSMSVSESASYAFSNASSGCSRGDR